jgi:hypothetical protein
MTPEQRRKFQSKWGPAPVSVTQMEEICRLVPERKEAVLALADAGLTGEAAEELLEQLRKPRLPNAERLHAQSGEVLAQRQTEELREMRERDYRIEHRSVGGRLRGDAVLSPEELGRWRYEQMLGFWVEQQRFAEEQQRQLEDNDPYNSRGGYR